MIDAISLAIVLELNSLGKIEFVCVLTVQVEVKIESSQEIPIDNIFDNLTVEAALYDTGNWYNSEESANLLSSNVANLKLTHSPMGILGFMGNVLEGKLEKPKLWSAEQVRNLNSLEFTGNLICYTI